MDALTLEEKLKEIEVETKDQVEALNEYGNLGACVLAVDLEENITGLIAALRLAVEQRDAWTGDMEAQERAAWQERDDAELLKVLEGESE